MNNFEFELDFEKNKKPMSRWKIFIFTFVVVFVLTTAQNLGLKSLNLINTQQNSTSVIPRILPKLEDKPNNFKLSQPTSLISSSFASSCDFDSAKSYVAIDYNTGEILMGKNISDKFPIASLTKLMTAVVSLDLSKPSNEITISKESSNEEPTTIGVVAGQKMTVEELLNASLLTSANDAAQALKDGVNANYGNDIFVEAMNEKAKFLKLSNSNFSNPQGFDSPQNYSSAEDLAILTRYALINYPLIAKIVKKDYQFIPADKNHKQFDLYNWNGLLDVYPGVEGVKIGNTDKAGYTTVVVSQRGGKKVLVVLFGAPGVLERDLWTSQILDLSFQKLLNLPPIQISETDLRQKYSTWKYWN